MKIRVGFVSNSSSSSFVILAKKNEEDNYNEMVNYIKELLYENGEIYADEDDYDDNVITINDVKLPKDIVDKYLAPYENNIRNGGIIKVCDLDNYTEEAAIELSSILSEILNTDISIISLDEED